jgi:uncharacterized protein involved in type VI secretion and phage assembly
MIDELGSVQDQVARARRHQRRHLFGVYRGTVAAVGTKTSGHEGRLGQLQVYVPEIWGENKTDLPWADPVVPFAGDGYGALMLPKKDDGVYLLFEGGNRDQPIWLGGFWSENAKRPEPAAENKRVIVSPNGHQIVLDDANDEIQLAHSSGNKITIGKDSIALEIDGGTKIVLGKQNVAINDTALTVDK